MIFKQNVNSESNFSSSWHVVLNGILFGYFHKNGGVLEVNEQRPAHLTEVLGQIINDLAYE